MNKKRNTLIIFIILFKCYCSKRLALLYCPPILKGFTMLEGLICPVCENTIEEVDLRHSLKCPHCSANLKSRKFLDFLEFLMANGIVENLDFFDQCFLI